MKSSKRSSFAGDIVYLNEIDLHGQTIAWKNSFQKSVSSVALH